MDGFGIGAAVRRKEDLRFLTGRGTYTDDINRPGQLYAYLLRSPHAHAEIAGIDTAKALKENFRLFQAKWGQQESAGYRPPGAAAGTAAAEAAPTAVVRPPSRDGRARVSLCLIVKNEEANLPACLGSAADLVDEVIVVEGPLDCLFLEQQGYRAVALLGKSLKEVHVRRFSRCSKIYLCLDGDESGIAGARRVGKVIGERAILVAVPGGVDPDEYLRYNGKTAFDRLINGARNVLRFGPDSA